jgi:thiamine pyrophosphokinase
MHVVIFAGGTLRSGRAVEEALNTADLIIAADKGALTALAMGYTPAFVVGDFDSLNLPIDDLEQMGCRIVRVSSEKDETDCELALDTALQQGASRISILGGLGGQRFDHTLANVLLLIAYETVPIRILDGPLVSWLLRGPGSTHIEGKCGDLLSLLPLTGAAQGIRTTNLYYPLYGETLYAGRPRGISNVFTAEYAEVALESGLLLILHTSVEELTEQ